LLYCFTARFAQDAKNAKLDIFSFAVDPAFCGAGTTAKENSLSFLKNNFSATFAALR